VSAVRPWFVAPVRVADVALRVASRAGVAGYGAVDVPAQLLAEALATHAAEGAGRGAVILGPGNGLGAAVASHRGYAVTAIDRHAPHVEATRRTLEANAFPQAAARVAHAVLARGEAEVPDGSQALVALRIPTDRIGVQQMIAEAYRALEPGGICLLSGANDEGAKSAAKALEQCFGNLRLLAQKSGCRVLSATRGVASTSSGAATLTDGQWLDPDVYHALTVALPRGAAPLTLFTRPGVFSWEHLDEAAAILLDACEVRHGESVLDIGAGAGVLGMAAARSNGGARVLLVESDADAVRCMARTIAAAGLSNAEVRASDIADAVGEERFDVVLTNPPFHLGKHIDLSIPTAFIEAAYTQLEPGGRLNLVANRTLPYERLIAERFGEVRTLHDGRRFKVLGASRRA
jgi:16S rRNA (guanine1207-N2)-methyltransferase